MFFSVKWSTITFLMQWVAVRILGKMAVNDTQLGQCLPLAECHGNVTCASLVIMSIFEGLP